MEPTNPIVYPGINIKVTKIREKQGLEFVNTGAAKYATYGRPWHQSVPASHL